MPDDPQQHITEALGGAPLAPLTAVERIEQERVRTLIQTVASCYNSLVARESDEARRTELVEHRDRADDAYHRVSSMSAEERAEVLATYPELLTRLRGDLDA
ncbi:hypothetical protein ACWGID_29185 [Kribbella sp. NPDC054772]